MKVWVVAVVAFVVAASFGFWAGASDPNSTRVEPLSQASTTEGPLLPVVARAGIEPPVWRVGDAWLVHFPESDFTCALVVVSATRTDYQQAFACEDAEYIATEEAVRGYWFMGRVRDDLAGIEDDEVSRFFSWPLVDGKTWEVEISGDAFTAVARFDTAVAGPKGPEAGYRIDVFSDDDIVLSYDYVPSLRWWGHFETASGFRMEVQAVERGWTGNAYTASARSVYTLSNQQSFTSPSQTFEVHDDETLLHLTRSAAGAYAYRFSLTDPEGRSRYDGVQTSFLGSQGPPTYYEATPGIWTVDAPLISINTFRIDIHAITVHEHAIG